MDWKVENALSRDVERQQLNKILKEVRAAIDAANKTIASNANADIKAIVGQMFTDNTEIGVSAVYNAVKKVIDLSVPNFFIHLQGDVEGTGQVNALGDVTIVTSLAEGVGGIEEAPSDGFPYWRNTEEWEQVPVNIQQLAGFSGTGFIVATADDKIEARTILGTTDRISVSDGDGADDPVIDFIDEGVQDLMAATLTDSATITWAYDDVAGTIEGSVVGGGDCCEILVADGISAPPVMLTNEDEDDFLYSD